MTIGCISCFQVNAQYQVSFHVYPDSGIIKPDTIFVAGNFNGWNPGDSAFSLINNGSEYTISTPRFPSGKIEFKFTRGSWNTVETGPDGQTIGNRSLDIEKDTAVYFSIKGWADAFANEPVKHTNSKNVKILDSAFFIPQIGVYRRIWIYLPPEYSSAKKRYPVIYANDGQNLFDNFSAPFGEWGIDEALDTLSAKDWINYIVVGIDSGPDRLQEYNPYDNEKYGKGLGEQYVSFLAETLKPYIDKHFRTLFGAENCLIMGSSMGGLISYYAALTRPSVFGNAGVFSPSFWIAPEILNLTDSLAGKVKGKFFFYVGKKEDAVMEKDMEMVADHLALRSKSLIYSLVDDEGKHNEATWRKWFPEFIKWINSNGYEYLLK